MTEPTREQLEAFIKRAGFQWGWYELESWGRRMAERAVFEIDQANATTQTMQKDAERYRAWRKAAAAGNEKFANDCAEHLASAMPLSQDCPTEDQIDASIDAAMKEQS